MSKKKFEMCIRDSCYSYEEQWQPKDFLVTFRMYQFNFDGQDDWVYQKYWETSDTHFIEKNV